MNRIAFLCSFFCVITFTLKAQTDSIKVIPPDTIYLMDGIYRTWDGNKTHWGFYEPKTKEWITEPIYDTLVFRNWVGKGFAYYEIKEKGKWGLLYSDRKVWIPSVYNEINYDHKAEPPMVYVRKDSLFGILKKDGTAFLEPVYDEILFDGFSYLLRKKDKWGIYDRDASELVPICFNKIYEHRIPERSLVQGTDTRYWTVFRWLKSTGNPCQIPPNLQFDRIEYFLDMFTVQKNNLWGLLDADGKELLPLKYEELSPFLFEYLRTLKVKQKGKFGLIRIDTTAKVIEQVPVIYDELGVDEASLKLKVRKGNKRDYLFNDEPYFDLEYEDVVYFESYRLFTIKKGKKWGVTREDKTPMITPKYDKVLLMDGWNFMVSKGDKWGIVNGKDHELIPIQYSQFDYRPQDGYFFAAKGDKWGIVSLKAGVVLDSNYDDLIVLPNRMFLVQIKGVWGVVGPGGRNIVPIEYSKYSYKPNATHIDFTHPNGTVFKYRLQ